MGKKQKHAAKLAERAARHSAMFTMPPPKLSLVECHRPPEPTPQEYVHQSSLAGYVNLAMFESARGTKESFRQVMSRLVMGRLIAYKYFADEDAAKIHLGIRVFLNTVGKQEESETMVLEEKYRDAIAVCMAMTDEMQLKITREQYVGSVMEFGVIESGNTEKTYQEVHNIPWEEFKLNAGW